MLLWVRNRLTYANVIATVALFLALGGTALGFVVNNNAQLAPDSVSGHAPPRGDHANIIAGSITSADIQNGQVTHGDLAPNSVGTQQLRYQSIWGFYHIARHTVVAENLAPRSVSSNKLENEAVTSPKLADAAVTPEKVDNSEPVHYIGDRGEPSFGPGYNDCSYGAGYEGNRARFYWDRIAHRVYLAGTVCGDGKGKGPMFQVPRHLWPAAPYWEWGTHGYFDCCGGIGYNPQLIKIYSSRDPEPGVVALVDNEGISDGDYVRLDGISFRVGGEIPGGDTLYGG